MESFQVYSTVQSSIPVMLCHVHQVTKIGLDQLYRYACGTNQVVDMTWWFHTTRRIIDQVNFDEIASPIYLTWMKTRP